MSLEYHKIAQIVRYYRKQFPRRPLTDSEINLCMVGRLRNEDVLCCSSCGRDNTKNLLIHHFGKYYTYYSKYGTDLTANDVYHMELNQELRDEKFDEDDLVILCKYCHSELHKTVDAIMKYVNRNMMDYGSTGMNFLMFPELRIMKWRNPFSELVIETILSNRKNPFVNFHIDEVICELEFYSTPPCNDAKTGWTNSKKQNGLGLNDFFWN